MKFLEIPIRSNDVTVEAGWWNVLRLAGIELTNRITNFIGAGSITTTTFEFNNNQNVEADIVGLNLDSTKYKSAKIEMDIFRKTSISEVFERTELFATHSESGWSLSQGLSTADSGCRFNISSDGQAKYTSSDRAGAQVSNTMTFKTTTMGVE